MKQPNDMDANQKRIWDFAQEFVSGIGGRDPTTRAAFDAGMKAARSATVGVPTARACESRSELADWFRTFALAAASNHSRSAA